MPNESPPPETQDPSAEIAAALTPVQPSDEEARKDHQHVDADGKPLVPSVGDRLAMSEEELEKLPEELRTVSVKEMQEWQAAQRTEAEAAAAAQQAQAQQRQAAQQKQAQEQARILENHARMQRLLQSKDEKEREQAMAIIRGELPAEGEWTPEQVGALKADWLAGHEVSRQASQNQAMQKASADFLTANMAALKSTDFGTDVPELTDNAAWQQIAQKYNGKGGLFGYFVDLGRGQRGADVDEAFKKGVEQGRREALAGTPGRVNAGPAQETGLGTAETRPVVEIPSRELMRMGNKSG